MAASFDPMAGVGFAVDLSRTVIACQHGDVGEALTSLCGALVFTAGMMDEPVAAIDIAIAALASARAKFAAYAPPAASSPAPEVLS